MKRHLSLWATAVLALGAIGLAAGAVVSQDGRATQPSAVQAPPANASAVLLDERPSADPEAQGVIVAEAQGHLFRLSPQGSLLGEPELISRQDGLSHDGHWLALTDCKDQGCSLAVGPHGGPWDIARLTVKLDAAFLMGEWAPSAVRFAALDTAGNLYFFEPEARNLRRVKAGVTAFAWASGDRLIFATQDGTAARLWRVESSTSAAVQIAKLEAPVGQLFASPDTTEFAFAQDDASGWRLMSVHLDTGRLRDFGNLGRGASQATAPAFAIAWSPDGSRIAVGPVIEPFALHVIAAGETGGVVSSFPLEKGYAGELKWSPDGSTLAISTYAPNRVWHEVFALDMADLSAGPRFLLDGCEIAWSPDGRFVAVKREAWRAQALAAIRVDTGGYWHVMEHAHLVPVAWGADSASATEQALAPVRRSGQLGK